MHRKYTFQLRFDSHEIHNQPQNVDKYLTPTGMIADRYFPWKN